MYLLSKGFSETGETENRTSPRPIQHRPAPRPGVQWPRLPTLCPCKNHWQLLGVGLLSAHCISGTLWNNKQAAKKHSSMYFSNHWFSCQLYIKYFEVRAYAINNLRTIKNSKYFFTCFFTSGLAASTDSHNQNWVNFLLIIMWE